MRFEPGPLALGCAGMGNLYRPSSDEASTALLDAAWAAGVRLVDTAPHYGYGLSEERLGRALRGRPRDEYLLATKVGRVLVPEDPAAPTDAGIFAEAPAWRSSFDFSADGVRRSIEASLERLGVDRFDVLHVHDPDDHLDQAIAEAYPVLLDLRAQGVLGAVGIGTNHAWVAERVLEAVDLDVVLLAGRITLLDQSGTASLLPACAARGVGVLAAGVFNSGILADPRAGAPFHYEDAPAEVVARAQALAAICARHDVPLAAAALQLPARHPAVTTVLVGASTAVELDEDARLLALATPAALWADLAAEGIDVGPLA